MAETTPRREQLHADFLAQTARIAFSELQRYFAAGKLIFVADTLDLVQVAVELAEDNTELFNTWLGEGDVALVSDAQARQWLIDEAEHSLEHSPKHSPEIWAVVADPWVLVQQGNRSALSSTESS